MTDKLRPPRLFLDHKGYYIIDGSKKKRINYGIDNKNVVNVVIENCRTKQKRKRSKAQTNKEGGQRGLPVIKQPSVQEQAMNSRYKLNQLLEQKLLAAQRQEVRNREINLLSKTDNSLSALTKDGVTQATLADQILGTQSSGSITPAMSALDYASDYIATPSNRADNLNTPINDQPNVSRNTGSPRNQGDYEPPIPQGEAQQLIAAETDRKANQPNPREARAAQDDDIEVDQQLGNPILPGEIQGPQIEDEKQPPIVPQVDVNALLNEYKAKIKSFLSYPKFKAHDIINLALDKFKYRPGAEGKQGSDASRDRAKEYLLDNADFVIKFVSEYKDDLEKNPPEYGKPMPMYKFMKNLRSGSGKNSIMTGLYNDQIDDMLKDEPLYSGCCSRDEIHKLNLNDGVGGFIYNTVPSDKPTTYDGHWRAIYIDVDGDKSIDHYDSFGEPAEQDIQEQVKKLLEPYNLPYYLKWKDNKIVNQRSNSSNCGFFCVNFLQDRFEGIPFVDSTGFSNVMKAEKMIKNKFKYLI